MFIQKKLITLIICLLVSTPVLASSDVVKFIPTIMMLFLQNGQTTPEKVIPLNDTGITWGGDYQTGNNSTCTGEIIAQQDCSHGRDVTHNDDSDGAAGFSFTKISASGTELPTSTPASTDWSCIKDNVTGLMWEKKTDDGTERDKENYYQWGGLTAQGRNHPDREGTYYDDWNALVNHANNNSLCGYSDWRVPSIEELLSITHIGRTSPAIDSAYFPNTQTGSYWSSSPDAGYSSGAWNVSFDSGNDGYSYFRNYVSYVRLVR